MDSGNTSTLASLSDSMANAVEKAAESLVSVHGGGRHSSSGVVFAPGMVLTTAHATEGDESITVGNGGETTYEASLVGHDHSSGIAVLRVEGLDAPAASASPDAVRVGQVSLAVGRSARSGGVKASFGIVGGVGSLPGPFFGKGRGRFGKKGGRPFGGPFGKGRGGKFGWIGGDIIQSDAASYPGMSGGALLDAGGAVIGIIAISPMRGAVTFAVPATIAWEAAKKIESRGGSTKRGFLGVLSQSVELPSGQRESIGQSHGLLVAGVEDGSPADKGGVIVGDIIIRLDEKAIEDTGDLLDLLNYGRAGAEAKLDVLRGGNMTTLTVEVAERS